MTIRQDIPLCVRQQGWRNAPLRAAARTLRVLGQGVLRTVDRLGRARLLTPEHRNRLAGNAAVRWEDSAGD